jgi:two-component system, response regulator PdtaR
MSAEQSDPRPTVVVVAEDEPLVRMLATDLLEDAGFVVVETKNATEALGELQTRGDVRAVFTDIEMPPGIDGLELARQVGQHWPRIAILIASGKRRPQPHELPPRVRFMPKPYQPHEVVRTIRDMMRS